MKENTSESPSTQSEKDRTPAWGVPIERKSNRPSTFIGVRPASAALPATSASSPPTIAALAAVAAAATAAAAVGSARQPPETKPESPKQPRRVNTTQVTTKSEPSGITVKVRCIANKSFRQMKIDTQARSIEIIELLAKKFRFSADDLVIFIPPNPTLPPAPDKIGQWMARDQTFASVGLKEGDILDLKKSPQTLKVSFNDAANIFTSFLVDLSEPLMFSFHTLIALLSTTDFKKEEYVIQLGDSTKDASFININIPLNEQGVKANSNLVLIPTSQLAKRPMASNAKLQGWLTKRSIVEGKATPTKKRYCVLKDNFLWYYKSVNQGNANGVIALDYYVFVADRSQDKLELRLTPNGVYFYGPPQIYMFNASSLTELEDWIAAIKDICAIETYPTKHGSLLSAIHEQPTAISNKAKLKVLRNTLSTKDLKGLKFENWLNFGKEEKPFVVSSPGQFLRSASTEEAIFMAKAKDQLQDSLMSFYKDETEEEKVKRMRGEIISELVYSENAFLKSMVNAQKYLVQPLSQSTMMTKQEIRDLFSNIEELIPISQKLLRYLQGVEELPPNEQEIGSVFISMAQDLQVYHQYCVEQDKSMNVREKLYQRPIFVEFLEETYKMPECGGLSLDNILIQPMQRITRYPLLLRELMKHTSKDHEDYQKLQNALAKITEIVEMIDRTRNEAENMAKVRDIRNRFVENLPMLASAGNFRKDGSVKKIKAGGGLTQCQLFLFNNILLVGLPQPNSNRLTLDNIYELANCLIQTAKDTKYKNLVILTVTDEASNSTFRFTCASEVEKDSWISAIKGCISKIAPTALPSGMNSGTLKSIRLINFDPDLFPITSLVFELESQITKLKEENAELRRRLASGEGYTKD